MARLRRCRVGVRAGPRERLGGCCGLALARRGSGCGFAWEGVARVLSAAGGPSLETLRTWSLQLRSERRAGAYNSRPEADRQVE